MIDRVALYELLDRIQGNVRLAQRFLSPDALTAIADEHDRTFSAELRRALRAYVNAQPKTAKTKGAAA